MFISIRQWLVADIDIQGKFESLCTVNTQEYINYEGGKVKSTKSTGK